MKKNNKDMAKFLGLGIGFIAVVITISYFGYSVFFAKGNPNQLSMIVSAFIVMIISILSVSAMFLKDKLRNTISIFTLTLTIVLVIFNFLVNSDMIEIGSKASLMRDFTNVNINEALSWASDNGITVEQKYEYSDNVKEYNIISQNVKTDTETDDIKNIIFVVSSGPNYDKETIIPSMVGMNVDAVIDIIKDNYLNNVTINYVENKEAAKDIVIEQNLKGQIRRNDSLVLTILLGDKTLLGDVKMIDLVNKSLFDATLFLKRNGINYKLTYEFSDTIDRGSVIAQSIKTDTTIKPGTDTVTLVMSKGSKIVVPDLMTMSVDDITKWIIDNKLKISYKDEYDEKLKIGKIISASPSKGKEIEEGTTISLVISKGQLKMGSFTTLNEFRSWASTYNINYREDYEYNDLAKGSIIKFSHEANTVIGKGDTVIVYLSNGKPITIPNFSGKTKSSVSNTCSSLGLNCTYYYTGYSSITKDTVISQNKAAGSTVVAGTYVNIGLSKGPATSYTVYFSEGQLTYGNPDATISTLKSWVASKYPGVTFTFVKKISSFYENGGFIHQDSPIKSGSSVTQGKTYQVWITTN